MSRSGFLGLSLALALFVAPALADGRKSQAGWNLLFYALWHAHHELGIDASGSVEDVLAAAAARA